MTKEIDLALRRSSMQPKQQRPGCQKVSEAELKKGSRKSQVSEARAAIAYRNKEEFGISGAEIARYLGVNRSSINRILA